MAESPQRSSSSLLLSALGGAVLGAAGLGWWLLSEADKRRQHRHSQRLRLHDAVGEETFQPAPSGATVGPPLGEGGDSRLQEKVRRLNRAIDEVRRQLEQLQPLP
jgi:hypothetical protein